jgi:uncharacterized small protein (DUF1192 family)
MSRFTPERIVKLQLCAGGVLADALDEIVRLRRVVSACHVAIGEDADSDDDPLGKTIAQIMHERDERIVELETEIGRLRAALKEHKHTDKCFEYAIKTASRVLRAFPLLRTGAYCIAGCAASHRKALAAG